MWTFCQHVVTSCSLCISLHLFNKCAHSSIKLVFPLCRYVNQSEHGCPIPPNQSSSTSLISQQTRSREKRETKRHKKTQEWRENIYRARERMAGINWKIEILRGKPEKKQARGLVWLEDETDGCFPAFPDQWIEHQSSDMKFCFIIFPSVCPSFLNKEQQGWLNCTTLLFLFSTSCSQYCCAGMEFWLFFFEERI